MRPSRQVLFWFFLAGFYSIWTAAWLLRVGPVESFSGTYFADPNHDTLYWSALKFLVWILPILIYLRRLYGVGLWEYLGLSRWVDRGLKWGLLGSVLMTGLYLAYDWVTLAPGPRPGRFVWGPFLAAVFIAPCVEELFFRGFMIRQLQGWWKNFRAVNLAASLAWVLVHWIGWSFQDKVSFPQSLFFSFHLLVLGLVFGYANRFSRSLWTSLLLHMANNFYSTHFWNYFITMGPHP